VKKLYQKFFFIAVLAFLLPHMVSAQSAPNYVSDAIEALKTSAVYVAPDTPGTDYNTTAELKVFLKDGDNIVLVMLPAEALEGTDIYALVKAISTELDNQKIVGLAVGREVIGYAPNLPTSVASDLMDRAGSVSNNDPITTLVTFSRNVRLWSQRNPQPTSTPTPAPTKTPKPTPTPIQLPKVSEVPVSLWILLIVCILAITIPIAIKANKAVKASKQRAIHQERVDSLEPIRDQIQEIHINVDKIHDPRVRRDLQGAVRAAYGLLEIFQHSDQHLGYTEAKFPALLVNVNMQVLAFIRHESGRRPLSEDFLAKLKETLLNYDSLFVRLQQDDPKAAELLASMIDSENTMIRSLGYLPENE
jgi:hypothetical protein